MYIVQRSAQRILIARKHMLMCFFLRVLVVHPLTCCHFVCVLLQLKCKTFCDRCVCVCASVCLGHGSRFAKEHTRSKSVSVCFVASVHRQNTLKKMPTISPAYNYSSHSISHMMCAPLYLHKTNINILTTRSLVCDCGPARPTHRLVRPSDPIRRPSVETSNTRSKRFI